MLKKGDIVRLKTGQAPVVITALGNKMADYEYVFSGHRGHRRQIDLVPFGEFISDGTYPPIEEFVKEPWVEDHIKEAITKHLEKIPNTESTKMAKLYQTEDNRFGTFLTKNSEGHLVLEMKGESGKVEAFPVDKLTEVVPYTVRIGGKHYEVSKGFLKKGDVIIDSQNAAIHVVEAIDTRASSSTALPSKFRMIPTIGICMETKEDTDVVEDDSSSD